MYKFDFNVNEQFCAWEDGTAAASQCVIMKKKAKKKKIGMA